MAECRPNRIYDLEAGPTPTQTDAAPISSIVDYGGLVVITRARLCLFHEGRVSHKQKYFSWCPKCREAERDAFVPAHPGETADEEDRLP